MTDRKKRIVDYSDRETIIQSDTFDSSMYIILEGEVEISLKKGDKKVVLAVLKEKDFFGEISLFTKIPRSATATARGFVRLTYLKNVGELERFLDKNPKFAIGMVKTLASRLARTDELFKKEMSSQPNYANVLYS